MYRVCSAAEMRQADKDCIEKCGIPGIILMENAAMGCVEEIIKDFGSVYGLKAACFCGKGNNGGDGLAIARLLSRRGAEVTVFLTHGDSYRGDAAINREIISHMDCTVCHVQEDIRLRISSYDIVVDAIFGTGMYGTVDDETYALIEAINESGKYVLSVDIPSGAAADTGEVCGICVNASKTVTFAAYKAGLLMFPACDFAGEIKVCDICTPESVLSGINRFCIDEEFVSRSFPPRFNNSQKGDYGKVLIIGGSIGMTGAPAMAAEAALRTGAGLVTAAVGKSLNSVLEEKLTEVMTYPLEDMDGHLCAACENELGRLIDKADAVLFGPGLGTSDDIYSLLEYVMRRCSVPLIIDADGLNVLSRNIGLIESCSCNLIFTPHEVEMSRLCGESLSDITDNRIQVSNSFAQEYGVTLILKGHHTIVTAADGTQYINITGNPGLATGGSGDVLAGITAALAARGICEDIAAAAAVYIHGKSGDLAADSLGPDSMTATDIIRFLPQTIKNMRMAEITCGKMQ
ncbi:MAG: NAD(P)H-hydrate dehydratase [Clostridia bacterium]|nr:NAD(P)H-hydrate dehydratase [Clostridia bacterium]